MGKNRVMLPEGSKKEKIIDIFDFQEKEKILNQLHKKIDELEARGLNADKLKTYIFRADKFIETLKEFPDSSNQKFLETADLFQEVIAELQDRIQEIDKNNTLESSVEPVPELSVLKKQAEDIATMLKLKTGNKDTFEKELRALVEEMRKIPTKLGEKKKRTKFLKIATALNLLQEAVSNLGGTATKETVSKEDIGVLYEGLVENLQLLDANISDLEKKYGAEASVVKNLILDYNKAVEMFEKAEIFFKNKNEVSFKKKKTEIDDFLEKIFSRAESIDKLIEKNKKGDEALQRFEALRVSMNKTMDTDSRRKLEKLRNEASNWLYRAIDNNDVDEAQNEFAEFERLFKELFDLVSKKTKEEYETVASSKSTEKKGEINSTPSMPNTENKDVENKKSAETEGDKEPVVVLQPEKSDDADHEKTNIDFRRQQVDQHGAQLNRLLIEVAAKNLGIEQEVEAAREALAAAEKKIHSEPEYDAHIQNYEKKLEELVVKIDDATNAKTQQPDAPQFVMPQDKMPISEEETHAQQVFQPTPKKGLWARAKEKMAGFGRTLFNKETGKTAVKVAYDSAASIIGVKFLTDYALKLVGIGDRAQYDREKKEAELSKKDIDKAVKDLFTTFEQQHAGKTLDADKTVDARKAVLEKVVSAAKISAEAKEQLLEKIETIYEKHKENKDKAKAERAEEIKQLLEVYIRSKIEKMKFAKDALNFALTMTGLSAIRGVVYAGTSLLERARKSSHEFAKQTAGTDRAGAEIDFKTQAKDVFVKSTIETVRGLTFQGASENASGKQRVMDFVRALGTVARGLGITNLIITGGGNHQNIDRILDQMEHESFVVAMKDAAVENIKDSFVKFGHTVANPLEGVKKIDRAVGKFTATVLRGEGDYDIADTMHGFGGGSAAEHADGLVSYPDNAGVLEHVDAGVSAFAVEHQLSERSAQYLDQFDALKTHPDSFDRILHASHVGGNERSHFTGSKLDNFIEVGGERRAVIFEELLKHDKQAAIKFLEEQNFSHAHLAHLAAFADKKGNVDFAKFVEHYNPNDKKMSLALFKAMQGKENTELANAGLIRSATFNRNGRTMRIKGDMEYFGLDKNGKPILSGDGQVMVKDVIIKNVQLADVQEQKLSDDSVLGVEGAAHQENMDKEMPVNMYSDVDKEGNRQFESKGKASSLSQETSRYNNQDNLPFAEQNTVIENINQHIQTDLVYSDKPKSAGILVGRTVAVYEADKPAEKNQSIVNAKIENRSPSEAMVSRLEVAPTEEVNSSPLLESNSEVKPVVKIENDSGALEMTEAQKDYIDRLNKIFNDLTENDIGQRMDSFTFKNGAENRLYDALEQEPVFKNFRDYIESIANNKQPELDKQKIEEFGTLLNAYSAGDQNWYSMIKNDELRLMLEPNNDDLPIIANNSHAVRIFDQETQEELFITNPQYTFVLKGDKLLKMDGNKVVDTWKNYKEALATAKQSSSMNR